MKTPLGLLVLGACWTSSSQTTTTQPSTSPDVKVTLAAVTLGDDCGDTADLPAPSNRVPAKPAPPMPMSMAPCAPGQDCSMPYRRHCDQTSMQLSLRASEGSGATSVRVKKVELLDPHGNVLAELESRSPAKWTGSSYVAWNQQLAAGEKLNATYALSAPDWNALTGGRWNAHSKTFQLRVTMAVGTRDRTAMKQSITPAMIEPPVPT
jgi:hypothetical protein